MRHNRNGRQLQLPNIFSTNFFVTCPAYFLLHCVQIGRGLCSPHKRVGYQRVIELFLSRTIWMQQKQEKWRSSKQIRFGRQKE